jgi:imidazolonepropionase-like amidohydrolase
LIHRFATIFIFFGWLLAACQSEAVQEYEQFLALVNGKLIDGTGAALVEDAVVLVQGQRILQTGRRSEIEIPEGARVVDVQGGTILPGIINAHIHGGYDRERLKTWAQAGVTTVRDMHAFQVPPDYQLRDEVNQDPKFARLVVVGNFITAPNGYPIQPWGGRAVEVSGVTESRQAAIKMLEDGADLIKIPIESGGSWQMAIPVLSQEEIAAITQAAHERGTLVSAHLLQTSDLIRALQTDVDDLAHMVSDDLPTDLAKQVVEKDYYWIPTLELWKNVGYGLDQVAVQNLAKFVQAGGKVVLGTDFMGYDKPFQLGMPIIEMELMIQAGMTSMQVIQAGTRNAANVCNLGKDLGTLEAGKIADILVVQGNPLDDIHALEKPVWVIHNGVIIRKPG